MRTLADAPVDVTLVDQDVYNTFQPLLYQVATGGMNPGDVTYPLRALAARTPNSRLCRGKVARLKTGQHLVELVDGRELSYDYLVVANGATTNYFGVPGAADHTFALYTRKDALLVRDHVFGALEQAAAAAQPPEQLRIVIVGGGPTGVETAGALAELNAVRTTFFPELADVPAHITLVEQLPRVLNGFKPKSREFAARALRERGVELQTETPVSEVRADGIVIGGEDQRFLPSDLTIWAAGVTVSTELQEWGLPQGRGGRVLVEHDLRVQGLNDVFAAGDVALVEDEPLPQLAQPAIQTGQHAGTQIRRMASGEPTERFSYRNKGIMATIGRRAAVAELPAGVQLRGTVAWLAWLALHIVLLLGRRNRLSTLVNLSAVYATWPRNLNVIVGDIQSPEK